MIRASLCALALTSQAVVADVPDCGLYTYAARVVRVVDGDTIVAEIDLGFEVYLHNEHLRLLGINTPERGEDGYHTATDALSERVGGKEVFICTVKAKRSDKEQTGKYGRYLATVYLDGENINQWMLEQGFAVPYE